MLSYKIYDLKFDGKDLGVRERKLFNDKLCGSIGGDRVVSHVGECSRNVPMEKQS